MGVIVVKISSTTIGKFIEIRKEVFDDEEYLIIPFIRNRNFFYQKY